MKRTIFALSTMLVVFVAVFAVLALRPVAKVNADHHGCSNATLRGNYGLVATGFSGGSSAPIYKPWNLSMLANFDGRGGLSGTSMNVFHPAHNPYNPNSFTAGTYTVNADCTCTWHIGEYLMGGEHFTAYGIVVDTGGDEVAGNLLSDDEWVTGTFDAQRVAVGRRGFF